MEPSKGMVVLFPPEAEGLGEGDCITVGVVEEPTAEPEG